MSCVQKHGSTASTSTTNEKDRRYPKRAFLWYDNVIVRGKGTPAVPDPEKGQKELDAQLTFGEWKDAQ